MNYEEVVTKVAEELYSQCHGPWTLEGKSLITPFLKTSGDNQQAFALRAGEILAKLFTPTQLEELKRGGKVEISCVDQRLPDTLDCPDCPCPDDKECWECSVYDGILMVKAFGFARVVERASPLGVSAK